MNILIHLDPLDNDIDMVSNRLDIYSKMAKIFIGIDINTRLYINSIHFNKAKEYIEESLLIQHEWSPTTTHGYKSLAYANNLPEKLINEAQTLYSSIAFKPDLIITNTPSTLIRRIWKSELILHYELGFFNRHPFPQTFQFDPIGYYHSSLLAKYPSIGEDGTSSQIDSLEIKKNKILNSINMKQSEVGSVDAVYIPLHSDSWATKTESTYINKVQHLIHYANKNKNKTILTNEKPQSPLLECERDELAKFKNIHLIENDDHFGIGSKLALICKQTHTFSPSLSLQTLFWGNKLTSPVQSSMIGWASLEQPIRKLSSYIEKFHISEFTQIPNLINSWEVYNPYSQKWSK
jgi:hypothetical protein